MEERLTPSQCIGLSTASCEKVSSNQCGLDSGSEVGVVVGKVLGGGFVKGGVVGVAVGEGDRRLMDWVRENNWDKMVERSIEAG
jgi:hypothetical protein